MSGTPVLPSFPESVEKVVEVPQNAVGKAIGKGGDCIKRIRLETGARIEVDQSSKDQGFSRFIVTGARAEQVDNAVEQLNEIIRSCESCDLLRPGDIERRVSLPEDKVGDVIGPRACVLDELKRRSGCRMDVVVKVPPGEMKYARIVGPPEACTIGAFLVNEIIQGNFDVGGVIRQYSERTGQVLFDPNHDMRRKGGGGGFSGGKGNNFGTPERYDDMSGAMNFRGKGFGGRFDSPPQDQWSRRRENEGRNWQSTLPPAPTAPPASYGSYGVEKTAAGGGAGYGLMNSNAIVKFKIPTFAYDKVMGVDNDVLRRISRETATQINELSGRDEIGQAILLLEAPSQTAVDAAIRELEEVIFTCERPIPGPEETQEFLPMNATDAAKMEGYRSCVIDDLKRRSGCRMEITLARPDADVDDNMLTIVGNAEQVKVGMMLAAQVLSGQIDCSAIERKFKEAHAEGVARESSSSSQDGVRRSVSHRASPY